MERIFLNYKRTLRTTSDSTDGIDCVTEGALNVTRKTSSKFFKMLRNRTEGGLSCRRKCVGTSMYVFQNQQGITQHYCAIAICMTAMFSGCSSGISDEASGSMGLHIFLADPLAEDPNRQIAPVLEILAKSNDGTRDVEYAWNAARFSSTIRLTIQHDLETLRKHPPPEDQTVRAYNAWIDEQNIFKYQHLTAPENSDTPAAAFVRLVILLRPEELSLLAKEVLLWTYAYTMDTSVIKHSLEDALSANGAPPFRVRQAVRLANGTGPGGVNVAGARGNIALFFRLGLGTDIEFPLPTDSDKVLNAFQKKTSANPGGALANSWRWSALSLLGSANDEYGRVAGYYDTDIWERRQAQTDHTQPVLVERIRPWLDGPVALVTLVDEQPVFICGLHATSPNSLFIYQLQLLKPYLYNTTDNTIPKAVGVRPLSRFEAIEDLNLAVVLKFAEEIGMESVTVQAGRQNKWVHPGYREQYAHMTLDEAEDKYDLPAIRAGGKRDENDNWRIDLATQTPPEARHMKWKKTNVQCSDSR